ncbi:YcnI family protein [Paenibacillus filicis]|uniref:YcnI family protein n=1 Tax=Paenibacillus gyeongsangnamensis TaxID=3388067 RepID=A0ABT4QHK6_9BACL|nr:YcnI family protein [Paenibacillus filicis]MCZ8516277.1 YcnI family protein [Paenibacillus filicis]
MKKFPTVVASVFLSLLLFAGIASAHVVVYPQQATQGTYEKFTVRVPTEKDIPTVKVEVKIPADVDISRFEPKPGWKYDLTKDASGKITSVVWTATGDGLSSTEFGEFNMQGKIGDKATELSWKAIQTYKDGSTVEWVGAAGSDKPASVTKINAKAPATAAPANDQKTGGAALAPNPTTNTSSTPLYLSIVALILGIISLLVSFIKKNPSK